MRCTKYLLFAMVLGVLIGCKVVDHNPALLAAPAMADAAPQPDGSELVVAAIPCADPTQTIFSIEQLAYNIQCGCEEVEGKTCTINAGSKVIWQFADSMEHNVTTTVPNSFGMSADTLSGNFEWTFPEAGEFAYGCTIHLQDMGGYTIVVK